MHTHICEYEKTSEIYNYYATGEDHQIRLQIDEDKNKGKSAIHKKIVTVQSNAEIASSSFSCK